MITYRILERQTDGIWTPFGVAYNRGEQAVLFVPAWRAPKTLARPLEELGAEDYPSRTFLYRWRETQTASEPVSHPIDLLQRAFHPRSIDLWELEDDLGELRRRSLEVPPEEQVEWGACIVLQDGRLRLVHQVQGWKDGVAPKCAPEEHDDTYVGFAHIHLPDDVTGRPYPGFSERDFRGTLADGDNLALVCNGPEVYALVRAADRTQPRRSPDDQEFRQWERLYDDLIAEARREMASYPASQHRGSDALNRALWQANRELCRRLGFTFYRGLWGQPLILVFRP